MRAVKSSDSGESDSRWDALEELCTTYWTPVYAWLRKTGHAQHDAEDLAQGFFASLLKRESLRTIQPGAGKFRQFLLGALKNHVIDAHRKESAAKRGGAFSKEIDVASSEVELWMQSESEGNSPELVFDRSWAHALVKSASRDLESSYAKAGKDELYQVIHPYLFGDLGLPTYEEVATQLSLSRAAVSMSVRRMREKFAGLMTEHVAHTLPEGGDVEDEIRYLVSLYAN